MLLSHLFPSAFFNVGMDIRSSSTDLTVLLISLDSQSLVLRNNKTCTSVVQPLPSLTMCTSQKSPLFLQLIISSIHTRQRVCETASLQRAIYHLSQERRVKKHMWCRYHILCALEAYGGMRAGLGIKLFPKRASNENRP